MKRTLGIVGPVIVIIGLFMPAVDSMGKGKSYFDFFSPIYSVPIAIFAFASIILVLAKRYGGLWVTGFLSICIIGYTLFSALSMASQSNSQLVAVGLAHFSWLLLIIGVIMMLLAAVLRNPSTATAPTVAGE